MIGDILKEVLDFKLGQEFFTTLYHNKLISCEGIIETANPVTPELVTASFECEYCGRVYKVPQGGGKCKLLRPEACTTKKCEGLRPKFKFITTKSEFTDYQEVWLKPLEQACFRLGKGQKVVLQNNLAGVKEGETIQLVGRVGFELKGRTNFARPILTATKITRLD
jgi:DNA replicative helicase MCM subunit Mcm2 (Cdc46/Mcm family)